MITSNARSHSIRVIPKRMPHTYIHNCNVMRNRDPHRENVDNILDSVREVCYQVVTNTNCTNLLFWGICGIDPLILPTHALKVDM